MTGSEQTAERVFLLDPYGKPLSLTALGDPPARPRGTPFAERPLIKRSTGQRYTMRYIPRSAGVADPRCYELLENEIRIGVRLARRLGTGTYPPELARLIAYEADGEEPCVVYPAYPGEPVGRLAGQLLLEQLHAFQVSLFRGLEALHRAGVVHGGIDGASVTWDGEHVHIGGFGRATLRGEPAPPRPAPWGAPERRGGGHPAHPGADIWSAALLVFLVATGKRVDALDYGPDLTAGGAALGNLLSHTFDPEERLRPTSATLLRRLHAEPPALPAPDGADQRFADGLRRYDEALARKRDPVPPPGPPSRPSLLRWVVAGLAIFVIGGLIAAALLIGG